MWANVLCFSKDDTAPSFWARSKNVANLLKDLAEAPSFWAIKECCQSAEGSPSFWTIKECCQSAEGSCWSSKLLGYQRMLPICWRISKLLFYQRMLPIFWRISKLLGYQRMLPICWRIFLKLQAFGLSKNVANKLKDLQAFGLSKNVANLFDDLSEAPSFWAIKECCQSAGGSCWKGWRPPAPWFRRSASSPLAPASRCSRTIHFRFRSTCGI